MDSNTIQYNTIQYNTIQYNRIETRRRYAGQLYCRTKIRRKNTKLNAFPFHISISTQGEIHQQPPLTHTHTHTQRERERDTHTERETDRQTHTQREREREREITRPPSRVSYLFGLPTERRREHTALLINKTQSDHTTHSILQSNHIPSNPIQSNSIQSNSIQSNPIQSNRIHSTPLHSLQTNPI